MSVLMDEPVCRERMEKSSIFLEDIFSKNHPSFF